MMKNHRETDPEFAERVEHFAFDEVVNEPGQQLDEVTWHMAILATLLGCQETNVFRRVVSQCLPYIGHPRSLNAVACVNKAKEG